MKQIIDNKPKKKAHWMKQRSEQLRDLYRQAKFSIPAVLYLLAKSSRLDMYVIIIVSFCLDIYSLLRMYVRIPVS